MLTAPPRSSRSTRLAVYLADVAALLCVAALLLHFQNGGRPTPSEQWTGEIRQASALVAANFATYVRTEFGTPGQGGRNDYRPPAAVAKIKDTIHAAIPVVREASEYAAVRALLRQLGGAPALLGELEALGFVSEGRLTTGTKPLNVFARVAAGVVTQPGMEAEQVERRWGSGIASCLCVTCRGASSTWQSWASEMHSSCVRRWKWWRRWRWRRCSTPRKLRPGRPASACTSTSTATRRSTRSTCT
mmetsp:Transcript_35893/g.116815  ORF Transcript_35893/g.116815 Transcript_35893/m.116815 type:complete len:246 (+) Transcript_35893:52-789(+)